MIDYQWKIDPAPDLAPCPHCGNEVDWLEAVAGYGVRIWCRTCGVETEMARIDAGPTFEDWLTASRAAAAKIWNSRTANARAARRYKGES